MARLSLDTLKTLPRSVSAPLYDPCETRSGILHFGVGNFHRAHQAVFTDDALNAGETGWAITGVSIRRPDLRDVLKEQDWLYSLTVHEADVDRVRVIGALREILVAPNDPRAPVECLADPAIRIVTLTVTEKGYTAASGTGALQLDRPDIQRDLQPQSQPSTTIGLLAEGLAARFHAGRQPVTLLSCDNLEQNGAVLRRAVGDFLLEKYPEMLAWFEDCVAVPSTMVDRIVPATTTEMLDAAAARLGVGDMAPVETEPFHQWIIEDSFPAGRPDWARSGVEFVRDVAPFEAMKLRLLNGAHSTLAATGLLAGHETVAEAIQDPAIAQLICRIWEETSRTLPAGLDTAEYTRRLEARFRNPSLKHRIAQIAMDGSLKIPQRLLVPLREAVAKELPCDALVFAIATWIRSNCGISDAGDDFRIEDPQLEQRRGGPDQASSPARDIVRAWLGYDPVFGSDLRRNENLIMRLAECYDRIRALGVRRAAETLSLDMRS